MRKQTIDENRRCPKCGKVENQIKKGYNRSGTQRCMCKECGVAYTINPKKREYPEETQKQAMKMYYSGVSGRGVGRILGMSKANVYNWIKKKHLKISRLKISTKFSTVVMNLTKCIGSTRKKLVPKRVKTSI